MPFKLIHYFHPCCAISWLEYSICVLPRQRCACASIFSSHIFFVFYSPNCSNSFLVFCEYDERLTPLTEKRSATWEHKHVYFDLLAYLLKKLLKKNWENPNVGWLKWSWRNEAFEGKKRRRRPKVLNNAFKIVLKKARYKIGDSTRKLSHS